jgi:hypothetical protein
VRTSGIFPAATVVILPGRTVKFDREHAALAQASDSATVNPSDRNCGDF